MPTLDDLTRWRAALLESRLHGVRRVRDQNGEEVEFRSDAEMARAIAAADREIAAVGRPAPNAFTFRTSKGLDR